MPQSQPIDDLAFLQELIDTPEPPKGTRGPRKPKDIRDQDNWYKLPHIISRCLHCGEINCVERGYEGGELSFTSNCLRCGSEDVRMGGLCSRGEDCAGLILYNKGPERVTAIVNEVEMCRIDFLEGLAYYGD